MFRRCLPMMCAGIVAACNASDTERPVVENPALAPADGTPSVESPVNDVPGATTEEPSSAPPDGPTAATDETAPVAGATPERDPMTAPLDPGTSDPGEAATDGPAPEESPSEDPATGEPTTRTVSADDPNLQYFGRVDFTDPTAAVYASPGVTVTARFRGDSISALLGDEFRYGSERGFHDVIVDGQVKGQGATRPPAIPGPTSTWACTRTLTPSSSTGCAATSRTPKSSRSRASS